MTWRAASRPLVAFSFLALAASSCRRDAAEPRDRVDIAVPYDLDTLDPHAQNIFGSYEVLSNLYEPLVTTDPQMKIQPCLAQSWESPDLLTWIFHLRPSVVFHGGKRFGAEDVVYSLERVLGDRALEVRGYLQNVAEVAWVDSQTVMIRTTRPTGQLLNNLNFIVIVPKGATKETLQSRADGTGPYSLVHWRSAQQVRMSRNERYWGRKPALARVEFHLGRSPDEAAQGLLAGRYQLAAFSSKAVEEAVGRSGRHDLARRENLYVKYLGYDLSRRISPFSGVTPNPFRDRRVRQAIQFSIDRKRLVDRLPSRAVPVTQPVPRFIFGFDPDISLPVHDVARARSLLREAGLEKGFDVVLHVRRAYGEAARLIGEQLRDVGIRVDVKIMPDPELFETLNRRDATLWLSAFGCPTGDASEFFDNAVHSPDAARSFGVDNYGEYTNPELDAAIERSGGIQNVDERRKALQGIMRSVMDELVWIPLYLEQDAYAVDRSFSWVPRSDSYLRAAEIAPRR